VVSTTPRDRCWYSTGLFAVYPCAGSWCAIRKTSSKPPSPSLYKSVWYALLMLGTLPSHYLRTPFRTVSEEEFSEVLIRRQAPVRLLEAARSLRRRCLPYQLPHNDPPWSALGYDVGRGGSQSLHHFAGFLCPFPQPLARPTADSPSTRSGWAHPPKGLFFRLIHRSA
jgi:hypothetical protein